VPARPPCLQRHESLERRSGIRDHYCLCSVTCFIVVLLLLVIPDQLPDLRLRIQIVSRWSPLFRMWANQNPPRCLPNFASVEATSIQAATSIFENCQCLKPHINLTHSPNSSRFLLITRKFTTITLLQLGTDPGLSTPTYLTYTSPLDLKMNNTEHKDDLATVYEWEENLAYGDYEPENEEPPQTPAEVPLEAPRGDKRKVSLRTFLPSHQITD